MMLPSRRPNPASRQRLAHLRRPVHPESRPIMTQRVPVDTFQSRARRLFAAVVAVLGLSTPASAALAQNVSPDAAPREWVAYAETVNGKVTEWLRSEDVPAVRLRAYVDSTRPAADKSSPPIVLQLWISSTGVVTRLEFPPFPDDTPNSDLRDLLVGRDVGVSPPRRMLLPLRLAVQLDPAPEPAPGATSGADHGPHAAQI